VNSLSGRTGIPACLSKR